MLPEEQEQKIDPSEDSEVELDREFRSPVGLYQQIGPPTDLYIEMVEGGYKLAWKPPRHGAEMLRYYTAIWSKEPTEDRVGAIQTNSNFVTGIGFFKEFLTVSTSPINFKFYRCSSRS